MSAESSREKLLNAPALMVMGAVIVVALWVLFPRQPAFRNPANLSAKDALSVAYLRVLVQSDPQNAPLRLSLVQVLTEAGLLDEARLVIEPLQTVEKDPLRFEIRLADLKLSLQQLYRQPPAQAAQVLRDRIGGLIGNTLQTAPTETTLDAVVQLAEQFGEPSLLAQTFEHLASTVASDSARQAHWWRLAARQHLAANAPAKAAKAFATSFSLETEPNRKRQLGKDTLRTLLGAGLNDEALDVTRRLMKNVQADAELYRLAADIAQPLLDVSNALTWLSALYQLEPDVELAERLARLRLIDGDLPGALALAPDLRKAYQPGGERHRLLAHLYDWNAQSRDALNLWLGFALTQSDEEAEARAFALAKDQPDDRALMQLIETVLQRRPLQPDELDAYVRAGLRQVEPYHLEQQLRQHLAIFEHNDAANKTLARLLTRMGEPVTALNIWSTTSPDQSAEADLAMARTLDAAGEPEKALNLLLRRFASPPEVHAEAYWMLMADLSWQLGRDTYSNKALVESLVFRPQDENILERLQQLAQRQRDERELERLARYGWERLRRLEDLQRLMRMAYQKKNWAELDRWLALAETQADHIHRAPDFWMFSAVRKMAAGDREAARHALKETLRLRGQDPEVAEAMMWLLLAEPSVDIAALDALMQPYRQQSTVSAPMSEALAAVELTLGRPQQAAIWFMQSVRERRQDFFWNMTVADNTEWIGCPAHANAIRLVVLQSIGQGATFTRNGTHPARLADYFFGVHDPKVMTLDEEEVEVWQSLRANWGIVKPLDNARFFALMRQRDRLLLSEWEALAEAVQKNNQTEVALIVARVAAGLQLYPAGPSTDGMLPLSLDDVERANRWFAGNAPVNPSQLATEMSVCRQTLAAVKNALNSSPLQEPKTP